MHSKLNYIFSLDLRIRIFLRFVIETLVGIFVYTFWLINLEADNSISVTIHTANFLIWCLLYKILGLHRDRLRFSSLRSYFPIFKISSLIGGFLFFESILIFENQSFLLILSTFDSKLFDWP